MPSNRAAIALRRDLDRVAMLCDALGFGCDLRVTDSGVEIPYLALHDGVPTGGGIGTRAMSLVLDVADRHGVAVSAPPSNGGSQGFLRKLGFAWPREEAICGETDLMLMMRPVSPPRPTEAPRPLLVVVVPETDADEWMPPVASAVESWPGDVLVLGAGLPDGFDGDSPDGDPMSALSDVRPRIVASGGLFLVRSGEPAVAARKIAGALGVAGLSVEMLARPGDPDAEEVAKTLALAGAMVSQAPEPSADRILAP